ncbi:MAG: glycosyltransferase [Candidatus Yanofskybacteria bacterium]|nr:glycosyltransferase [Candidatus Yanofskybacteria bacterium]
MVNPVRGLARDIVASPKDLGGATSNGMRFCYINITQDPPSRDAVYLRGLEENDCEILYCNDGSSTFLKKIWQIIKKHGHAKRNYDMLWVGYGAHNLVPLAKLISRKKVVFNALGSLYEGRILSRRQAMPFSPKATWIWLIDFLAFHLSDVSLVETEAQKEWLMKKFFLGNNKLTVALTGVDDNLFFREPEANMSATFTVLFRGGFLPESGIEYAIDAAEILKNEKIKFRIIGRGQMEKIVKEKLAKFDSKNVEWISQKLEQNELRRLMQECHTSLGQLSDHNRLTRTIPHKAFESLAMKIPYLTARNKAVLELLTENETCFCCRPADARDLADKIIWIKNNYEKAQKIAENAYRLYLRELTPKILARKVLESF